MAEVLVAVTLDELMALGADARVEVINGEIVEMCPSGGLHHVVVANINRILDAYVIANKIGSVFPAGLLHLMHYDRRGLKDALAPDVSFIRKESFPDDWDINLPFPGTPDLAVEVISPSEGAADVTAKVRKYLDRGTTQVWVVYPDSQEVYQYRRDSRPEMVRVYRGAEEIDAESLFPGIKLVTSDFFTLPGWVKE